MPTLRSTPAIPGALCVLFAAVLTACGGGSSDSNPTATAEAATGDQMKTAMAISASVSGSTTSTTTATTVSTLPTDGATSTTTTVLAKEGGNFSVSGTQTVRYGAGSSWITMSVAGMGQCTNGYFGNDPIFGTAKACELVTTTAVSSNVAVIGNARVAAENGSFTVTGTQTVRYGAGANWIEKSVTGSGTCSNGYFGNDPAFGVVKSCELVNNLAAQAVAPKPVTAWVRIAIENEAIAVTGTQQVRFGDGVRWATKSVTSSGSCTVGYFGSDPAWGAGKFCEIQVTVPSVTQVAGKMPVINKALIPGAANPFTNARVRALTTAELSQKNWQPDPSNIGSFREPCNFSHMSYDDPIVYPGTAGAAHLHSFYGNDKAAATSTADSLYAQGNSSCYGGTLNRTAYWVPSMIDTRTGQPLVSVGANFYYKLGYWGVKAGTVRPFPKGLRIIAGDANGTTPVNNIVQRFACANGGSYQPSIPNCAVGDMVIQAVVFPQCWDGVNLDSPDHKSHMAYGTGAGCPSTHPVALPEITINVDYIVTEPNNGTYWKLSSDNYDGPGGYSLHADWFGGWDPAINSAFLANCINGNLDCHDMLLGDGRILY